MLTIDTPSNSRLVPDGQADPVLAEHIAEIRQLGKRMIADIVEIGRRLTECQEIVGHGGWAAWLDANFSWSDRTARNFMSAFELVKSEHFSDFDQVDLPITALYLLAAPSTPETVRTEILDRAKAGEAVSVSDVQDTIASAKTKTAIDVEPEAVLSEEVTGTELEAEPKTVEDAEAEVTRLKALKAELKNNNEDKIGAGASAKALAGFKAACGKWLPNMNSDDLQAGINYFAEAVEVPAEELMPDLKRAQFDVKIAKAEVTALKRKLAGKLPPRESRAAAWARLASEAASNVEELIEYQSEFESMRDAQPDSLQNGPLAQKCDGICDIDLQSALSILEEAANAEVPLGFGRD
jgi:hypothetical protein